MPIITNLEKYSKNNKNKKLSTSKKVGIVLLILATIGYLGLFIRWLPFLHDFLVGTFGLFSYVLFLVMYFIGGAMLKGAKYVYSKKYVIYLSLALISVLSIFHIAFSFSIDLSNYGSYLIELYSSGLSVGGLLLGIIIFPLQKYLSSIGAIFLFLIVLALAIWLIYDYLTRVRHLKQTDTKIFKQKVEKTKPITFEYENDKQNVKIGLDAELERENLEREKTAEKLAFNKEAKDQHFVDKTELNEYANGLLNEKLSSKLEPPSNPYGSFGYNIISGIQKQKKTSQNFDKNKEFYEMTMGKTDYVPPKIKPNDLDDYFITPKAPKPTDFTKEDFLNTNFGVQQKTQSSNQSTSDYSTTNSDINNQIQETTFSLNTQDELDKIIQDISSQKIEPDNSEMTSKIEKQIDEVKTNQIEDIDIEKFNLPPSLVLPNASRRNRMLKHSENQTSLFESNTQQKQEKQFHKYQKYVYPTVDLLNLVSADQSTYNEHCEEYAKAIETTLENFGIPAKVINTVVGPAVTRYELDMPAGISVNRVASYSNDIAMAVASSHGVRIQAPIPGKSAVGIEIPNKKVATVGLREIIESKEFLNTKYTLGFAVGKEVDGSKVVADMSDLRHLLVAGATGSGKSVALNTLIVSLLFKYSPEELRFILFDPKQVEFFMYNGLPHLLTPEVITQTEKAIKALNWAIDEMERRYTILRDNGVKQLTEYNALPEVKNGQKEKLPQIVIILDEVGDIMAQPNFKKDFEERIIRLTQKARAAGIFLILATQRPSVDVITGVIKSNLPSRMAFAVTDYQSSATILGKPGAEKLLGRGDMLFSPQGIEPYRVQGCYISNDEIKNVVNFVKQNNESYFDEEINNIINKEEENTAVDNNDGNEVETIGGWDQLMKECLKLVIRTGSASTSMLQRRFCIGNPRAAKIIDQMEQAKFIAGPNGSKPRNVYITPEQFREIFGEGIDDN